MTNLEFYKDELKDIMAENIINVKCVFALKEIEKAFGEFARRYWYNEHVKTPIDFIDWLLAEHKGPVKLKQWEYDLIRANEMSHDFRFKSFRTYRNMKAMGYFESITDTSMTLKEILDNCEVVDD